jgi:hypothetical protein
MKIVRTKIRKSLIAQLPEEERTFFFLMGHVGNELNVLQKLFYWCAIYLSDDEIRQKAHVTQALVVAKLLVGKLYEGWALTEKVFFASRLSKVYEPLPMGEGKTGLDHLKRYFGRENLLNKVRNTFAFHYSPADIQTEILLPTDQTCWEIYLAESSANSLYYASEVVAHFSLLEAIDPGNHQKAMDRLIAETMSVAGWFMDFIEGCMICVTEKHFLDGQDALAMEDVDIGETPSLDEVQIPFFVRTPRDNSPQRADGEQPST